MDSTPNSLLANIQAFKPFSFIEVQEIYATELMKSIVQILKKLDITPEDILVYVPRLAKLRGLKFHQGREEYLYYGVSYSESDKFEGTFALETIKVDGKYYQLMDYWVDPMPFDPEFINCDHLQTCSINTLELVYNYLRMELKAPKDKRRFTIKKKED